MGASASDCALCPVGRVCGIASTTSHACPAGSFCALGSTTPAPCPEGYYCPTNTMSPLICPASYYCPLSTAVPIVCFKGTYCPQGSGFATPCPLGYKSTFDSLSNFTVLGSLQTACTKCDPGYYGTDVERLACYPGLAGYYYHTGATSSHPTNLTVQYGDICPLGYYCPPISSAPLACPLGSYQPSLGQGNITDCLSCPAGTYQDLVGQSSCLKCSSSSLSLAGSSLCTCIGANRAFQPGDGSCICAPGYEFVDSITLTVSSNSDGVYDCQPIVYTRCSTTQVRNSLGQCVDSNYCAGACGTTAGGTLTSSGLCQCANLVPVDQICDAACRARAPTVRCDGSGNLVITDPATSTVEIVSIAGLDAQGGIDCSITGATVYSMSTSLGSFQGIYGVAAPFVTTPASRRLSTGNVFDTDNREISVSKRRLANTTTYPTVSNPLVCIKVGDSILFEASGSSYPVYMKDSLINTNPSFDYSQFRYLAFLAKQGIAITNFAFTFTQAGYYQFGVSDSQVLSVIIVTPDSVGCSTSGAFVEASQANYILSGTVSSSNIVLSPDWSLVIGLVIGMLVLVNLVAGFLYYFRKKAWDSNFTVKYSYRDKNKQKPLPKQGTSSGGFFTKTTKVSPIDELASGGDKRSVKVSEEIIDPRREFPLPDRGSAASDDDDENDPTLPRLIEHLAKNREEMDNKLATQSDQITTFQASLVNELQELKRIIHNNNNNNHSNSPLLSLSEVIDLLNTLKIDCNERTVYEERYHLSDKKFLDLLNHVSNELNVGAEYYSRHLVSKLSGQLKGSYAKGTYGREGDNGDREDEGEGIKSAILHELLDDLLQLNKTAIVSLIGSYDNEKKRRTNDDMVLDKLGQASQYLGQDLILQVRKSKEADITSDGSIDNNSTSLRLFVSRLPGIVLVHIYHTTIH